MTRCGALEAGLRPLAEFSAVADEDRIRMAVEKTLQRPARLDRMELPALGRTHAIPGGGPIGDRRANFVTPSLRAPVRIAARAPSAHRSRRRRPPPRSHRHDPPPRAGCDRARSVSGSICRKAHCASIAGARPNASVKSSRLPRSRMQSASARISANAPRHGSLIPRGLSMPTHGIPVGGFERREAPAAGPRARRRTGEDQRTLRRPQRRKDCRRIAMLDRDRAPARTPSRAHRGRCRRRTRATSIGKAHVHRARPPGSRDAHGPRHVRPDVGSARAGPRRLGHGRRHLGLPHLLERAASLLVVRRECPDSRTTGDSAICAV